MEGLWRPGGVNILKGRVRAEGMERSHMAVENIGEQQRMLRMKFYVTMQMVIVMTTWTLKMMDTCRWRIRQKKK